MPQKQRCRDVFIFLLTSIKTVNRGFWLACDMNSQLYSLHVQCPRGTNQPPPCRNPFININVIKPNFLFTVHGVLLLELFIDQPI